MSHMHFSEFLSYSVSLTCDVYTVVYWPVYTTAFHVVWILLHLLYKFSCSNMKSLGQKKIFKRLCDCFRIPFCRSIFGDSSHGCNQGQSTGRKQCGSLNEFMWRYCKFSRIINISWKIEKNGPLLEPLMFLVIQPCFYCLITYISILTFTYNYSIYFNKYVYLLLNRWCICNVFIME
jgi:hypothetical protein